jgi:hypothetical protein
MRGEHTVNARMPRTASRFHRWWLYLLGGAVTAVVDEFYVAGSWNGSPYTAGSWLRASFADENGITHPAALSTVVDWIVVAALGLIAGRACRALAIRTGFAQRPLPRDRVTTCVGYLVEAAWCAVLPVALLWVSLVHSGFVP